MAAAEVRTDGHSQPRVRMDTVDVTADTPTDFNTDTSMDTEMYTDTDTDTDNHSVDGANVAGRIDKDEEITLVSDDVDTSARKQEQQQQAGDGATADSEEKTLGSAEPERSEPKEPEPKEAELKEAKPKQAKLKQAEPKESQLKELEPKGTKPDEMEPSTMKPPKVSPNRDPIPHSDHEDDGCVDWYSPVTVPPPAQHPRPFGRHRSDEVDVWALFSTTATAATKRAALDEYKRLQEEILEQNRKAVREAFKGFHRQSLEGGEGAR